MQVTLINVLFSVVLFCPSLSTAEEDRFFWSAEYVSKPNNYYYGAAIQIPVIGSEELEIQCKVRAVSEDPYTIIWDYEYFNANTTGRTILVNNTAGDEFAMDTITVNISNPAVIDDRDIICSWENGKFSDTISLQFKVYVEDKSKKGACSVCEGADHVKLVRPGKPRKEDANMQEMIKEKAKKKYEKSGFSEVSIDSKGEVCCCRATKGTPEVTITTTTTTTKEATIMAPKITTIKEKNSSPPISDGINFFINLGKWPWSRGRNTSG